MHVTELALEVRRLSKRYGRHTWALRDVDLALEAGGIIGLVGPNGAGKSTLLKTWIGFERPTAGEVRVFGADPWRERAAVLSHTAYLPQSPALYRDLRVSDHLEFVAHYRGAGFDRAWAAKRLVDLRVPLDAVAGSLSGGQAAQVGLAIALRLRAAVLLLDEPLANLDPLARREFIEVLVDDLSASGATAILSSHIVSDIERACGRLVVLGVGRLLLTGAVEEILAAHAIAGEADALEAARDPDARPADDRSAIVAELPGGGTLVRVGPAVAAHGCRPATVDDVVLGYLVAGRALEG